MPYPGSKAKRSGFLLHVLNAPCFDGWDYVEPFLGMAHVLRRVERKRRYTASDANPLLMCLLRAVQRGDALPTVSRERYAQLRRREGEVTVERSVAAFSTFRGKEWGGYVDRYTRRGGRVDDVAGARERYYALLRENAQFARAELACCDYRDHPSPPDATLVYCDPPYRGVSGYSLPFDHDAFWATATRWSREGRGVVLVSEYAAPDDWVCVASQPKLRVFSGGDRSAPRVERLFVHASALPRLRAFTASRGEGG